MYNDIKKIVRLQEKHNNAKSSKEKSKLEKKIIKLQSKYSMYSDDTDFGRRRNILFYEDKKGRRVLVDDDVVIAMNFVPIFISEKLLSFMIAYFILIFVFLIVGLMNAFGLVFSDTVSQSFSFVVTSLAILLNLWTMISCRETMVKYKWLLALLICCIAFNSFMLALDIITW